MTQKRDTVPRSYVQSDIIAHLISKKEVTFTQLQKFLQVSRTTLSHHLSELQNDGSIEFTKKGREKHYRIKSGVKSNLERILITLSSHYKLDYTMKLEDRKESKLSNEYKKMGKWINSYFMFLIIKSLKTGENWIEGFEHRGLAFITMNYLLSILFDQQPAPIDGWTQKTKEQLNESFKQMNEIIVENKLEERLESMMKVLSETYPENMKSIDFGLGFSAKV